ncbi:LysR family transcriptional regulator [Propylenella binzhouense]|uniref:LysR family transcriptional regulator n=1 Tax=Propylenella binzhouense TaxID=2555902 RepID=A0A964T4S4_9HYPH|nr:LysR family transcriptional regulator [Propylenella binzhouense]MYZ48448.1 LysR family transcriptional regulator [Propylenella binzhouense]
MELRQIHYFTCLYEEGSVTRAAKRLNVVQPAVSTQIGKLEDEFGQILFDRTPRGMVPTQAGHEIYRLLKPVLQDLMDARQRIIERTGRITGSVIFGAVSSISAGVLSGTLIGYVEAYPDVSVTAVGGYNNDLHEAVQSGALDFAFINQVPSEFQATARIVLEEEFFLIAAPAATGEARPPIAIGDLAAHKLVLPSKRHALRMTIDRAAANDHFPLVPRLELDELIVVKDLVQRSDWVTILPATAVHGDLQDRRLGARRIVGARLRRQLACTVTPRRPLTAAARLLIDRLSANLAEAANSTLRVVVGHD